MAYRKLRQNIIPMNMHPGRVAQGGLQVRKYDKLSTLGVAKSHSDDDRGKSASLNCNRPQDCNK